MLRKYEKTYRIVTPDFRVKGKLNLSSKDQKKLLNGKVEITEKVDGANVGIVRTKNDSWTLQKRRGLADSGVHEQFAFFWNWARNNEERILKIPEGHIVYGELCFAVHHIFYDQLPSYFLVYDIWDGRGYLDHSERVSLVDDLGFNHVPILHYGSLDGILELEKLVGQSKLSSSVLMEGVVVKNYRKQARGKLVRPEFVKELNEGDHWMKFNVRRNRLQEGVQWDD